MQKKYFLALSTLLISAPSLISMESALTAPEKPKFIVTLHLKEISQAAMNHWANKENEKIYDQYYCSILGIQWEDNNKHWTESAVIRKSTDNNKDGCDWARERPKDLPLPQIANYLCYKYNNPHFVEFPEYNNRHFVKFPVSVPGSFVERLEKDKSITLTKTLFVTPVEIVIELGELKTVEQQEKEFEQYMKEKNSNSDGTKL